MKLNFQQANELNSALNSQTLRSRHMSVANRILINKYKAAIKNELAQLGNVEFEILIDHKLKISTGVNGSTSVEGDPETLSTAQEEITKARQDWSMEIALNFISQEELIEYCADVSTAIESVLFEYLLKN